MKSLFRIPPIALMTLAFLNLSLVPAMAYSSGVAYFNPTSEDQFTFCNIEGEDCFIFTSKTHVDCSAGMTIIDEVFSELIDFMYSDPTSEYSYNLYSCQSTEYYGDFPDETELVLMCITTFNDADPIVCSSGTYRLLEQR